MAFLCHWVLDLCSSQKVRKLWGFQYITKGFYLIIGLYLKYNFASDRKKNDIWLYFGSCQAYKLVMISYLSQNQILKLLLVQLYIFNVIKIKYQIIILANKNIKFVYITVRYLQLIDVHGQTDLFLKSNFYIILKFNFYYFSSKNFVKIIFM